MGQRKSPRTARTSRHHLQVGRDTQVVGGLVARAGIAESRALQCFQDTDSDRHGVDVSGARVHAGSEGERWVGVGRAAGQGDSADVAAGRGRVGTDGLAPGGEHGRITMQGLRHDRSHIRWGGRLIEGLAARLPPVRTPVTGLKAATATAALARGRTCYDHLAGRIGVAITTAMIDGGLLDTAGGFAVSDKGFAWFDEVLGVDTTLWGRARRPVARECLDWTERRSHLAGLAAAGLCRRFLDQDWLRRIGSGRAVRLTPSGRTTLRETLGIDPAAAGLDS